MKQSILAGMLAAAFCGPAAAAAYYVVVPLPGKAEASPISVALQAQTLPVGLAGARYPDFDFRSLLTVTGDTNFNPEYVRWSVVSGAVPAGLAINADGLLTGTPSADGEATFDLKAYYKSKTGTQRYVLTIRERGSIATVLGGAIFDWGALERADLPQVRGIALQNTGDRPMSLSATVPAGPFVLAGSSCVDVAPGATCSLVYRLADTAPGDYGPVTSMVSGASGGAPAIKLLARVLGPLVAAESGLALDFRDVTVSDVAGDKAVTWRNKGNVAMSLVPGAVPAPFALTSNSCTNVAPGATCQTTFTMATAAAGAYSGSASFAGGGAAATVTLAGKVVEANLTASRASVAFGGVPVNTSVSNTVMLTNAGTVRAPLALSTLAAPFSQTTTCASVLETGASCGVTITYRPTDLTSKSGALTVAALSIPVSGTGEKAAIETAGAGRRWQDGTYAASCLGYLAPGGNYQYAGATGSGIYTVDPDGAGAQPAVDVYCDMTTNGGGWTLVANYGRNGQVTTPLMNAGGDYNVARNPASPLQASGGIGVSRWANAFGFSRARLELVAGDDVNQVATFFKSVTYANLASWGAYAAVEPNPTTTCTDAGLTQNCTNQPFDHNYNGTQTGILLMRGVNLVSYGYPASPDMPVHSTIDGEAGGFCSVTGNNNNNQWHDSYSDGHWGNGLRIWLR